MRFAEGGRALERLAGRSGRRPVRPSRRWRTVRSGPDPWRESPSEAPDQRWLRGRGPSVARGALQQGLLFPVTRLFTAPAVEGADDLVHAPQPAVIAPNHGSDVDTPLVLLSLPGAWRARTVVGAASDRFYRNRFYAVMTGLWINTFPFDRSGDGRGIAAAAELLREGHNVLLYPQGTRSAGTLEGFRSGVARLCVATGAPLVPVHVSGTALIMPKDRGLSRRGKASVRFGSPLLPGDDESVDEFLDRSHEAMAELATRRRPVPR
jgi:1-acyl-sn-glycerol-3-phosphate acyltransferase